MKINPTDWVLYCVNPLGSKSFLKGRVEYHFDQFDKIPKYIATRLEQLASKPIWTEIISYSEKYGSLMILLVADEKVEKYAKNLETLFKASKSSYLGFKRLFDSWYHKGYQKSIMGLYGTLNRDKWGDGTKKVTGRIIAQFTQDFDTYTFKEKIDQGNKTYERAVEQINNLKKFLKMETKEKFLVELRGYDREAKKTDGNRDFVLIYNVPDKVNNPMIAIDKMLKSNLVDTTNDWDLTHDILTINKKPYVITSGDYTFTGEKWDTFTNKGEINPILDINWEEIDPIKFVHKEGEDFYFRLHKSNAKKMLTYLQGKYPNKEYTCPSIIETPKKDKPGPKQKESKKEYYDKIYQERKESKKDETKRPWQKKLEDLPKSGQSEELYPKKVCCMEKKTGKFFRGPKDRVDELVESGGYIHCQKKYWKAQIYKWDEDNKKVVVSSPSKYNEKTKEYELIITTNINKSPKGVNLGERSERRQLKEERRKAHHSHNFKGHRVIVFNQRVPGQIKIEERQIPYYDEKQDKILYKKVEYKVRYNGKTLWHRKDFYKAPFTQDKRNEQSTKDMVAYEQSLGKPKKNGHIRRNKNPKRQIDYKAFEAELYANMMVKKKTIWIKALDKNQAQIKLDRILKASYLKKKPTKDDITLGKITGKVKAWIKPTGINRKIYSPTTNLGEFKK